MNPVFHVPSQEEILSWSGGGRPTTETSIRGDEQEHCIVIQRNKGGGAGVLQRTKYLQQSKHAVEIPPIAVVPPADPVEDTSSDSTPKRKQGILLDIPARPVWLCNAPRRVKLAAPRQSLRRGLASVQMLRGARDALNRLTPKTSTQSTCRRVRG